jgi:hypothetical protein
MLFINKTKEKQKQIEKEKKRKEKPSFLSNKKIEPYFPSINIIKKPR